MKLDMAATIHELELLTSALNEVAMVLWHGRQKHPTDDGFAESVDFHIERARRHLELPAAYDRAENHLAHAACRLLMALEARAWANTGKSSGSETKRV